MARSGLEPPTSPTSGRYAATEQPSGRCGGMGQLQLGLQPALNRFHPSRWALCQLELPGYISSTESSFPWAIMVQHVFQ
jgi:hypothetical protein